MEPPGRARTRPACLTQTDPEHPPEGECSTECGGMAGVGGSCPPPSPSPTRGEGSARWPVLAPGQEAGAPEDRESGRPVDGRAIRLPGGASRRTRGSPSSPDAHDRGAAGWGKTGSETVRWTVSRSNARPRRAGRERAVVEAVPRPVVRQIGREGRRGSPIRMIPTLRLG